MPVFDLFGPPDVEKLRADENIGGLIRALNYKKGDSAAKYIRRKAAYALGEIGDTRAVAPLIEALRDQDADLSCAAAYALGQIGDTRAVEPLITALEYPHAVRFKYIDALGQLGDTRAVEPLIAFLDDYDYDTRDSRSHSMLALGEIGDARAVEPLLASLNTIFDDDYKTACDALRLLNPTIEVFLAALEDFESENSWKVRSFAAEMLGEIGDTRAVEVLIASLENENEDSPVVRATAANALGEIGDSSAVKPLIAALKDEDGSVRHQAAVSLENNGWVPSTDESKAVIRIAKKQFRQCVEIGAPAVKPLIDALNYLEKVPFTSFTSVYDSHSPSSPCVEAAKALIKIYKSGELNEKQRLFLLAQREKIEQIHGDENIHKDIPATSIHSGGIHTDKALEHFDIGAGDFPNI